MRVRIKRETVLHGEDRKYADRVVTILSQRDGFLYAQADDGYKLFLEDCEVEEVKEESEKEEGTK